MKADYIIRELPVRPPLPKKRQKVIKTALRQLAAAGGWEVFMTCGKQELYRIRPDRQ